MLNDVAERPSRDFGIGYPAPWESATRQTATGWPAGGGKASRPHSPAGAGGRRSPARRAYAWPRVEPSRESSCPVATNS